MDLRSGREAIPVTDLVIQAVENLAIQQGITTLKFTNNTRQSIYPADWIAGVEYEDTEDDEYRPAYNQPFGDDENLDKDIYARIDRAEVEDLMGYPDKQNEEEQVDNEGEQVNEAEQVENEEKQVEHEDNQEAEDYQIEPDPFKNPTQITIIVLKLNQTMVQLSPMRRRNPLRNQLQQDLDEPLQDHRGTTQIK
jgi:hypothetical protein